MNSGLMFNMEKYISSALTEDIPYGDISTDSIIQKKILSKADLIAKEDGIICGLNVFEKTFKLLNSNSKFESKFSDGDEIKKNDLIGCIYGYADTLLIGERVALNFLQRMSGIATKTNNYVQILKGTNIKLVDTRKTIPNMRIFDKYSVKIGGATNHRFCLSDCIMLKDNHINFAGGIKKAVDSAKLNAPFTAKIEVEVENLDMLKDAIDANVDIIMLDNMDYDMIKKSIELIDNRALIEVSGNVDEIKLKNLRNLNINFISCGNLTNSVKAIDISMKNLQKMD